MRRPSLFTTMWRGAIDVREGILFILYPHRNRVPPREALKGKRVQNYKMWYRHLYYLAQNLKVASTGFNHVIFLRILCNYVLLLSIEMIAKLAFKVVSCSQSVRITASLIFLVCS